MKKVLAVFWCCLLLFPVSGLGMESAKQKPVLGPEACWSPQSGAMEDIRNQCRGLDGAAFETCFINGMKKSGASSQAVAFTASIGNMGYLRELREMGPVDAAFVFYPFRTIENQGFLLINGNPPVIDVDDLMLLSAEPLKKDPLYTRLKKKYPAATLWQGDRSESAPPFMEKTANGGQRFTVRYRLLNGCHACELLGYVRYIFKFDRTGLFTGTEYLGIETSPGSVGKGEALFSNPSRPIMAGRGKIFTLRLRSNPTTGYIWQLAEPLNDKLIRFIGNEYWGNKTGLVGAGGSEIWTFRAIEAGKTEIVMKCVRPWEKGKDSGKDLTFKILIRENE